MNKKSRAYVPERHDKLKGLPAPRRQAMRQRARSTSVQRGAASARAGSTIGDALPDPAAKTKWRKRMVDQARLEQAQRAASMVTAARDFYAQVKRTFSRLSDLEKEIGPIMVSNPRWREDMRRVVANARAARLNPRDFAAVVSAAGTPELPSKCRPLVELARMIPPYTGGAVKDMAPERGPSAGVWRGSITVEFYVAGYFAGARSPVANHTHTVEVELLASKYLSVLYATGPRSGPAEAAKKMVATLLERSRAAVEAMVGQARAAEDSDTEKN